MIRTENSSKKNSMEFTNVSDFVRYLNKNFNSINQNSIERVDDWTGVRNWYDFENYLDEGNPDITDDVRKHTKYYIDKFEDMFATTIDYEFDVVGQFFDIGAVMVGEPEAWIKQIEVKEDKFIELNIQGAYSDGTDLAMVRKNGAKVFAIASVLEKQGYLIKINMIYRTTRSNEKNLKQVTEAKIAVKDYNQGLDYKKFGILLGVPMFRRGFLRLLEIEYGSDCAGNYGRPEKVKGDINLDQTKDISELENMLKKE